MSRHKSVIPDQEDINDQHQTAAMKFKKKNGRWPNSRDPEFWEMSEAYKVRYQELIDIEDVLQAKIDAAEKKGLENPVFSKNVTVTEKICVGKNCSNIVEPSGKRGRPATKCLDCRTKKVPSKKPAEKKPTNIMVLGKK